MTVSNETQALLSTMERYYQAHQTEFSPSANLSQTSTSHQEAPSIDASELMNQRKEIAREIALIGLDYDDFYEAFTECSNVSEKTSLLLAFNNRLLLAESTLNELDAVSEGTSQYDSFSQSAHQTLDKFKSKIEALDRTLSSGPSTAKGPREKTSTFLEKFQRFTTGRGKPEADEEQKAKTPKTKTFRGGH